MGSYGLGAAMGAGIRGAREAMDYRTQQQQQQYGMQRQQTLDQRADTEFAQEQQDRVEYDLPEKRATSDDRKRARKREQANVLLAQAAARQDPKMLERVYNEFVDDGYTAKINQLPDGRFEIQHPNGAAIADSFDQLVYGKEDGTGLGLYDMINTDAAPAKRSKAADRKAKLADTQAEYTMRGKEARATADYSHGHRMQEISAGRVPAPRYGMDADGNQMLIEGTSARPVMGPGGKPLTGMRPNDPQRGREDQIAAQMASKAMQQASEEIGAYGGTPQEVQVRAKEIFLGLMDLAGQQSSGGFGGEANTPTGRTIVKRGKLADGTRVVQYSDGTVEPE